LEIFGQGRKTEPSNGKLQTFRSVERKCKEKGIMRTIRNNFGSLAIIGGLIAHLSQVHAQTTANAIQSFRSGSAGNLETMLQAVETTTPLSAELVPKFGNLYSAQNPNWPLWSWNINNLPAWDLEGGNWLLADQDFDYAALEQQNAAPHLLTRAMGLEMDSQDIGRSNCTIDTNSLWLEITNVANGLAYLNLHNSTNQIYAIWSASNLLAEWNVETEVWPDTNQNQTVTPFTVPTLERQNLFVRAQDWTDVLGDGGIPLWWYWLYFGRTDLLATNLNSVGSTLLFDYTNNLDPNFLVFSIVVTNQYVNTSSPVLPLILGGGSAFDMAVLVNDANHADAVWQPYNSNVVVHLNAGDGGYDVRVGLRKSPINTNQVWNGTYLILDTVPPLLVVTNPMPGMVSQSPIQLQGYANKPLIGLTFDVSNATGIFTNQTGYLTGLFYDDNLSAYTTNYFQCPDIGLGNGTNFITLHATDLAGNTANVCLMLDYVPNTNSPVLNLIWPPDGTQISDNNFTVQAQTDDNTSTVMAVIADSNDNTNTVSGLVEQNGTIWVKDLPLAAGANQLTLTVANASGSSTTNLTVYQSSVLVTVAPLTADQLNQTSITVTGTISEPGDTVTVNGVPASVVDEEGNWEAYDVPVSAYGTAIIDVEVYAGNTSNFAHNNLRFTPLDSPPAGNSIGSHISNLPQPVAVKMASYFCNESWATTVSTTFPDFMNYEGNVPEWYPGSINTAFGSSVNTANWAVGVGGTQHYYGYSDNLPGYFNAWDEIGPTQSDQSVLGVWGGLWSGWESADDSATFANNDVSPAVTINTTGGWSKTVRTRVVIAPAGQEPAGQTNSYLVLASALEVVNGIYSSDGVIPLPPEWLQINGQTLIDSGITNDDGSVSGETIVQAPAGVNWDVTPVATQLYGYNDYTFTNVQALDITHVLAVDNNRDGQISLDGSDTTTASKPFHFWINDSKESGDVVSGAEDQIPGQPYYPSNYSLIHVNGRSDLVNFFPVALCLSNILQWLPPTNGFEYHLVQNDSAVKFVYTSLTLANAFDYLTNTASNGYGANFDEAAANADTIQVTNIPPGIELDTNWLAQVQTNGGTGIILVEGCAATTKPLWLEIWRNGSLLGGVPLYLSIDGVEKMYRHKNLRDGADAPSGLTGDLTVRDNDSSLPTQMSEPANYPDSLYNQWFFAERWFIFVVGSNVGGQNARGWVSEVFKRMYWSGNKAKFVGVSWFGDPYGDDNDMLFDYQMAVRNAFATAPSLSSFVNNLSGKKTIAGHSLGCGLIASAIADQGMNVNNACLMDAAFAQECFDGDADDNLTAMRPAAWQDYSSDLWAAHWHERFSDDARANLTWRGRFSGAIDNVYSFYSSTEDVLGEYDGSPTSALVQNAFNALTGGGIASLGSYAWVIQEKCKGNKINLLGIAHGGSDYGGWGFNIYDGYLTSYPIWYEIILPCNCSRRVKTPAEIGTITQDMLDGSRYNPLFNNGWGAFNLNNASEIYVNVDTAYFTGPSWIMGLYDPLGGNTIAADSAKRAQLLAEAIPALSLPVGANTCGNILSGKQFNMPIQFVDAAHWPSDRGVNSSSGIPNWHHSDMDQVAYPYLYKFYYKLVSISNQ
jgi:hypothetical protein